MRISTVTIILGVLAIMGTVYFVSRGTVEAPVVETPPVVDTAALWEERGMTFFITSRNPGAGANLGGLSGADQHCQTLATEMGAGDHTWHAYLSAIATASSSAVDARDRIGAGPWHNADGVVIALDVDELHAENTINKDTGLNEAGSVINGRGDTPNEHDILTGSNADGTLAITEGDTTCSNWTSESEGSAMVGHHDRLGPDTLETATSWNAAHGSRGCSLTDLNGTGGGGLLYCFAVFED